MGLSRSALYSALWSCLAHGAALGLAAALVVSPYHRHTQVVRISLIQKAVPLPIGGNGEVGRGASAQERALTPPPQPQVQPKPKPRPKPKTMVKKFSPPVVVAQPSVEETPPSVALPDSSLVAKAVSKGNATNPDEDGSANGATGAGPSGNGSSGSSGGSEGKTGSGAGEGSGNGRGGGVSAQPDYHVNPKPPYPLIARRLGVQGVVILRVHVREDGRVAAVELAHSSGFTLLDESATRTVRESWRFLPARIDGTPVSSWVEVPIRFVLADS